MRTFTRWMLAALMIGAGLGHLFWARTQFRAQVPDVVPDVLPIDRDGVVVASGGVEIAIGSALLLLRRSRPAVGAILAAFLIAVFPGNIEQWAQRRDSLGLDTDRRRFARLFLQPVLVVLAIWSTRPRRAA